MSALRSSGTFASSIGRVMPNHNGLIGRYPGADGMKTGCFNVVASATRDGRRLITVIMGSPSATERTIKAGALFDWGFSTPSPFSFGERTLEDLPRSDASEAPDMRPYVCGRGGPMPAEDEAGAVQANAAASGRIGAAPRELGPRAPLQPVLVWTGRAPNINAADTMPVPSRKGPEGPQDAGREPGLKTFRLSGGGRLPRGENAGNHGGRCGREAVRYSGHGLGQAGSARQSFGGKNLNRCEACAR